MIGSIADVDVLTPPLDLLGRFTKPGDPDKILEWLGKQDLRDYSAVIVSTDMIAYGGLISSRIPTTPYRKAIDRLRTLQLMRRSSPETKFFAFSSIMRLAPTALQSTKSWRDTLTKLVVARSRLEVEARPEELIEIERLKGRLPERVQTEYYAARSRDHLVQKELCRMTAAGVFDYLILGQDDAQPTGPHVSETVKLRQMVTNLKAKNSIYFCEGIDQHSNVLLSRAILHSQKFSPNIRLVFSDNGQRNMISDYETKQMESNLSNQIEASGAKIAAQGENYDYSLYVNTADPRPKVFARFLESLEQEIDQGLPVALADINLGKTGTGDLQLFEAIGESGRAKKLLGYAGWNTAGNTLGTVIPASNVYLCARQMDIDPMVRELNQQAFLLHRLVNDFQYHRFTRPEAYALRDKTEPGPREEVYGHAFDVMNTFVQQDVAHRVGATFQAQFLGKRFYAGTKLFQVDELDNLNVQLPWPRAYEVRIGFTLRANEVVRTAKGAN